MTSQDLGVGTADVAQVGQPVASEELRALLADVDDCLSTILFCASGVPTRTRLVRIADCARDARALLNRVSV